MRERRGQGDKGTRGITPNSSLLTPNAQCPMPHSPFPIQDNFARNPNSFLVVDVRSVRR